MENIKELEKKYEELGKEIEKLKKEEQKKLMTRYSFFLLKSIKNIDIIYLV